MRVVAAPKKYSDELRERATRMRAGIWRRVRGRPSGSLTSSGSIPEALRTWVRQAEIDGGLRPGASARVIPLIFLTVEAWTSAGT